MSDCGEGFSVRATRQNAPRRLYGLAAAAPPRPGPAGGVKAPGASSCVDVTVPCGMPSAARLSHVPASADEAASVTTNAAAMTIVSARVLGMGGF